MRRLHIVAVLFYLAVPAFVAADDPAPKEGGPIARPNLKKSGTGTLTLEGINISSTPTNIDTPTKADKDKPLEMDVKFAADAGTLHVEIVEKQIELETKFGKLAIPLTEIRRIELAQRILPETQKKIDEAIKNLGSDNFITREKAQKELTALKETAYTALQAAGKSTDPETRSRATSLVNQIRQSWTPNFKLRTNDLVVTTDSSICGTVLSQSIKVKTKQFGEQQLQLAEIKSLGTKNSESRVANVMPNPGTMLNFQQQPAGKQFYFQVTGNTQGFVCGTDVYTMDSALDATSVHAGALRPGETGAVCVTILPPQPNFYPSSSRNGVGSNEWNQPSQYPVTFRVERAATE